MIPAHSLPHKEHGFELHWGQLELYEDGSFYITLEGPPENTHENAVVLAGLWGRTDGTRWVLDEVQPGFVALGLRMLYRDLFGTPMSADRQPRWGAQPEGAYPT